MNVKRLLRLLRENWYYRVRTQEHNVYDNPLSHEVKVMTYNIRCDSEEDGKHNWEYRKRCVAQVIRDERPSVVCLQELAPHSLKFLLSELGGGYECYSVDARNGRPLHENWFNGYGLAILYDRKRFMDKGRGHLWLSDTPSAPSRTWGNKEYRIAMYVDLYDTYEDRPICVYNTHFDHTCTEAVENSARLLAEDVTLRYGEMFIAGDFNTEISMLKPLNESLYNNVAENTPTFSGFRFQKTKVVDTIYTRRPCTRKVIVRRFNGYNASDHNAVVVSF